MKKEILMSYLLLLILFNACTNNSSKENFKADVNNLAFYVDSADRLEPVYTEKQWASLDAGYNSRLTKVEKSVETDANEKARIEETKIKYNALKERYQLKIREANDRQITVNKRRPEVSNQLLGEGRPGPDNRWDFVTTQNVVSVYEDFVEKVRKYGDDYKDEDWDEVRLLWKSLNVRKDEIDKDMSTKDNAKVAGLRVAYTAIKSVNRPVSKVREEVRED